jgi:hypothetical protein
MHSISKLGLCILLLLPYSNGFCQSEALPELKTGYLLFQDIDCGPLCDAIEAVTEGIEEHDFSHIGLVYIRHDSVYVLEAIGKDVHLTPLPMFAKRSSHPLVVAAVKKRYPKIAAKAVKIALQKCGIAYDDAFLYNNGKYYCSELIYDAFKEANNGEPFFQLQPMTFKIPGKNEFFPAWIDYYKQLGIPIPEGQLGINPGGISQSDKLDIIRQ